MVLVYELVVYYSEVACSTAIRNGADGWMRNLLQEYGISMYWVPPLLLLFFYAMQSFLRWWTRPCENLETLTGMILESGIFGMSLWLVAGIWNKGFLSSGMEPSQGISLAWVTYLGAGIYEEALFRLLALQMLFLIVPGKIFPSVPTAFIISSVLFALAHHWGTYGEPLNTGVFLFRALAGLYFCFIYMMRGFGIAVGTHVIYDFIVSV
jgi:Type II CAAX prenyl endopeptidase Rce1-like